MMAGLMDSDLVEVEISKDGNVVKSARVINRQRRSVVGTMRTTNVLQIDPGIGVGELKIQGRGVVGNTVEVRFEKNSWRIVKDFGKELEHEALYARIMSRHNIPGEVDGSALKEAEEVHRTILKNTGRGRRGQNLVSNRVDLREQTVITIDADKSKDLDDALSARVEQDGCVRVWVHIADVAEHVKPGGALDAAAREVPTSVYLPMRIRPMLPELLSEKILSLLPEQERGAMTVEMRIDTEGNIVSTDIYESLIKSNKRLSYITVAGLLSGRRELGEAHNVPSEIKEIVGWLWHAASRLGVQRKQRGGVDGLMLSGAKNSEEEIERDAHMLVERLMVAANEAVASWLEMRGMPALYRCHMRPDEESLQEIEATARAFGYNVVFSRPVNPKSFAAFCDQIANSVHLRTMWDVIGGALEKAIYTTENHGHFGLGSESYLHFTSPLRRYADLLVHRVVKSYLRGGRDHTAALADLQELEEHISETTNRAGWAERDAKAALALLQLHTKKDSQGVGYIRGVSAGSIKIHAPSLASIPGMAAVRKLGNGYKVDEVRRELVGRGVKLGVGSEVRVKTKRVEPISGILELQILFKAENNQKSEKETKKNHPDNNQGRKLSASRPSAVGVRQRERIQESLQGGPQTDEKPRATRRHRRGRRSGRD
jgi:ribonuclease R